MASASMNDIKARMKSVESTMQITKAMELVATSKLRRAKQNAENSRHFSDTLNEAIKALRQSPDVSATEWSTPPGNNRRTCYIVIAGDRGLAGGYNSNIFRLTASLSEGGSPVIIPIGKKAVEYYRYRNAETLASATVGTASVGDAMALSRLVCKSYLDGEFDEVVIVYTRFVSMMTQQPSYERILPLEPIEEQSLDPIYEGDLEEILASVVPDYIGGLIYSKICESVASEHASRRSAMSSANKNATEMIDTLMLKYNRARQAVITQEITEIVSGAEAL
ncbi:MAG: ATP synthase F1 subunit gamma [Clostridia bacterium]|nr:ATP synthase F1 subunit gamma [Clostridia bacterium]